VPDGYATQNGGMTGGGSATPKTVTTAAAFESATKNDDPAVIIVQGKLNVGSVKIGSNKTIIGADVNSGLHGGTIRVREYPVFTPPYSFTMDKVEDVKRLVTDPVYGAGNCLAR
jgi:pectate lyase